jgi:hypothetical protein
MNNRVTPKLIRNLSDDEIFVFGSNLSGIHGAGAARTALIWGAKIGVPEGLEGKTYAIPTRDYKIKTMPVSIIKSFVDEFITFAKNTPSRTFLVTEIGCGLAGLTPEEVAPLFSNAIDVQNIFLPQIFWDVLYNK